MKKSVFRDNNQEDSSTEDSVSEESNDANEKLESLELPKSPEAVGNDELSELKDRYLRSVAEFENFKKRALKEKSELIKYSGENLARDLLEVLDSFGLAFSQNTEGINAEFLKGFEMIYKQLSSVMEKHSIRADDALGTKFDPNRHQALASVPSADKEPGTILEQFKKAYFIKDKLLRPAQVVVSVEEKKEEN